MDSNTFSLWQVIISSSVAIAAIIAPLITNKQSNKKSVFEKKLSINYEAVRIAYGRFAESYGQYRGE